jgi:hypothetical protein
LFKAQLESDDNINPFYQVLEGKTCALWDAVPPGTRQRLRNLR